MSSLSTREERGFSLVEVMVSLAIFLIASMGLFPLLVTSMQVNRGNSLHAQARRLAGEVMTELQVIDYAGLASVAEEPWLAGEIELSRRIEPGGAPGQSTITVTARWEQQGRLHSYRLQSVRGAP